MEDKKLKKDVLKLLNTLIKESTNIKEQWETANVSHNETNTQWIDETSRLQAISNKLIDIFSDRHKQITGEDYETPYNVFLEL